MPHHPHESRRRARVALLTVSDTRTPDTDTSGAAARTLLEKAGHEVFDYRILPDEPGEVRDLMGRWISDRGCDGVIVNGGTGISPRDRTYEAIDELLEKRLEGFGELFRWLSYEEIGSAAMMSRAVGGIAAGKVVFSIPGSTPAVRLALERLIIPELSHLLTELDK